MSTLYYIQGPWLPLHSERDSGVIKNTVMSIGDTVNRLLRQINFDIKEENIKGITRSLVSAVFDVDSSGKVQNAKEVIKSTHNTLAILEQSIHFSLDTSKYISHPIIPIYIRDLSDPKCIQAIQNGIKNGLNPTSTIFEIIGDDYGLFNLMCIKNLRLLLDLGFEFSINDFYVDENGINTLYIDTLLDANVVPAYIKIPKSIFAQLHSGTIFIGNKIRKILRTAGEKGIPIISTQEKKETKTVYPEIDLGFLKNAKIETEDILTINGTIQIQEGLVRFSDGISTQTGLALLKHGGKTEELMKKMIESSIFDAENGQKRSVNVYIKNLADPYFPQKILHLTRGLSKGNRKNLIFEILEDRYGAINNQVLKNLRFLHDQGFTFAIDDLYIIDEHHDCMSREVLEALIEFQLYPDYIKIDGRQIEGIRTKSLTSFQIGYLREVIGYFSLLPNKPIFICEWIQDTDHAIEITKILGINNIEFLFQGMHIKAGIFGISTMKNI